MTETARDRPGLLARGLQLDYLTVGWNVVEGVVAILAALAAGSVALLGFGIDSFVETASGRIIVWRLVAEQRGADHERIEVVERRAQRLVAISLTLLAIYIVYDALATLVAANAPIRARLASWSPVYRSGSCGGSPGRSDRPRSRSVRGRWRPMPFRPRRAGGSHWRSSSGSGSTPHSVCGGLTRWRRSSSRSSCCARLAGPGLGKTATEVWGVPSNRASRPTGRPVQPGIPSNRASRPTGHPAQLDRQFAMSLTSSAGVRIFVAPSPDAAEGHLIRRDVLGGECGRPARRRPASAARG